MRYTWAVVAQAPARRKDEVTSTYFAVIYVAILLPVVGLGATAMLAARTDGQPARQHAVRYVVKVACLHDYLGWRSAGGPQPHMRFEATAAPSVSEPSLAQATSGATNS